MINRPKTPLCTPQPLLMSPQGLLPPAAAAIRPPPAFRALPAAGACRSNPAPPTQQSHLQMLTYRHACTWLSAVLGLRCSAQAYSRRGDENCSLAAMCRLWNMGSSHGGAQAKLPWGTYNLPRPGIKPMSPALAGRLVTSGKVLVPSHLNTQCSTLPIYWEPWAVETMMTSTSCKKTFLP